MAAKKSFTLMLLAAAVVAVVHGAAANRQLLQDEPALSASGEGAIPPGQGQPLNGTVPTVTDLPVPDKVGVNTTAKYPALPAVKMVIKQHEQCGGTAGVCATVAADLGINVTEVCINGDWPATECSPGDYCYILDRFYRQCRPGPDNVKCQKSKYPENTNLTLAVEKAAAAWAGIGALNATGLPANAMCNASAPTYEPMQACSSGEDWIVSFKVTFLDCELYTTVDAHMGAGNNLTSYRVAPYDMSKTYTRSDNVTGYIWEIDEGCGGFDGNKLDVEPKADAPWTVYMGMPARCAYNTTCTREHEYYWKCDGYRGA